jgi:hypothetical protein
MPRTFNPVLHIDRITTRERVARLIWWLETGGDEDKWTSGIDHYRARATATIDEPGGYRGRAESLK